MSQVTAVEESNEDKKAESDLLFYLEEPIVYKDEIIGGYSITEESMTFQFNRAVDLRHPVIKSFLVKHTLLLMKQFYHGFDFQFLLADGKATGLTCTPIFDSFIRSRFIERLAWALSKAMPSDGVRTS